MQFLFYTVFVAQYFFLKSMTIGNYKLKQNVNWKYELHVTAMHSCAQCIHCVCKFYQFPIDNKTEMVRCTLSFSQQLTAVKERKQKNRFCFRYISYFPFSRIPITNRSILQKYIVFGA